MGYAILLILSRIGLTSFDPTERVQTFRKCRWFRLQLALAALSLKWFTMELRSCPGALCTQLFAPTFRQVEIECGPGSDSRVEGDAPVMLINDHFANAETQSGAASAAAVSPICLCKPLEYLIAKVFRDSWTEILD